MLIFTYFFPILAIAWVGCQEKKNDAPASSKAVTVGENQSTSPNVDRELDVEEDSVAVLQEHLADLGAFLVLARGPEDVPAKYSEIVNHATSLLTHYQFELMPPIRRQSFRDAAYVWDLGELYATRLAETYDKAFVAKQELGEAWRNYQTSRELILQLKNEWASY